MAARYFLQAGGRSQSAEGLDEFAGLLDSAIRGADPIELIHRDGGDPLDDAEVRELFERLRQRTTQPRGGSADGPLPGA